MNSLRSCIKTIILSKGVHRINYEGQRSVNRWVSAVDKEIIRRKKKLPRQLPAKRSTFLDWNRSGELFAFNARLSESFDTEKLEQAFTHRSYIFQEEQRQKEMGIEDPSLNIQDNQELIMRGAKLTSEIVLKYLAQALPQAPEDAIISLHDYLLSERILARTSKYIGTKEIILTEEHPVAQRTLADTFLALVAALADSVDANHAAKFVRDFLIVVLAEKDLTEIWNPPQPTQVLDVVLAKQDRSPCEPRLLAHAGQSTLLAVYHIGIYCDKQFLGSGSGQTIREAKNVAAMNVLSRMFGLSDSSNPMKFDHTVNVNE